MNRPMRTRSVELDLADIQGNLLTAYGRQGFPKGRFFAFHVAQAEAGRKFIRTLFPRVTTALRWPSSKGILTGAVVPPRPIVTLNLAFTFRGLLALGLPVRSLRGMPDEFIDGMAARTAILGDDFGPNRVESWDPVWRQENVADRRVHILVTLNSQMQPDGAPAPELDETTATLLALMESLDGGVRLLEGHRGAEPRWQNLSALLGEVEGKLTPVPVEHFGLTDGIGDPVFAGQFPPVTEAERVVGNGKLTVVRGTDTPSWVPLATGEFLLGYPDEAQEIAGHAMPEALSRNGTFMAYRKLHEDVRGWQTWVDGTAAAFGRTFNISDTAIARSTLVAKMTGRWAEDGVPISLAPTWADREAFNARVPVDGKRPQALSAFTFFDDPTGVKCPLTAHLRRANPRDMLDPLTSQGRSFAPNGTVLNNRRRILRRGLPYGPSRVGQASPDDEQGIVMLNVCASLFRQFEFVHQQWMNYGLDFNAGNDTCPVVGNHGPDAKFVIPAAPDAGHPPFIADRPPNFVTTRGGAYFFVPSMTALRMIGMGLVDPT